MKLSIFSVQDHYPAQARTVPQLYGEIIAQAELADALGYDTFWVAEHHFHEYGVVPNPAVMLSTLAQRTKRLRLGTAISILTFHNPLTVAESYAGVDRNGEVILYNANIPEYLQANRFNHEPKRPRKLLLHAKEIAKLARGVEREGMTIVPLRIYFNAKGRAKIAIALGRGKKLHDKRESEKARDWNRDKSRLMRERG